MLEDILKALGLLNKRFPYAGEPILEYPFAIGPLTSNGAQYSTEITTAGANIYNNVEVVTVGKYLPPGQLVRLELGLTGSFAAASTATADLIYQWAAADMAAGWNNLHTAVTKTDINTTNIEETYSGRWGNINSDGALPVTRVPFRVKLMIQCNEANEGQAKTSGASYVKFWYIPD